MPILLDCTLRDGGYYNNWNFSERCVGRYLQAMSRAEIDYVELGFRTLDPKAEHFANATDALLSKVISPLPPCDNLKIAVMINAKEFIDPEQSVRLIAEAFKSEDASPVSLVRVAAHFTEAIRCEKLCWALKRLGYRVALNLMQCSGKSDTDIALIAKVIDGWKTVDVLYLADSLGSMDPTLTIQAMFMLQKNFTGDVGFHAHDNKGFALMNCFAALDAERLWKSSRLLAKLWLDCTVDGMGRGAGNVQTEYLMIDLNKNYRPVINLAIDEFTPLKNIYRWGPNLFYHLSAIYSVHPTYVQSMLSCFVQPQKILCILKELQKQGARLYDEKMLIRLMKETVV